MTFTMVQAGLGARHGLEEMSTSPWLWEQRKARDKSLLSQCTKEILGRE